MQNQEALGEKSVLKSNKKMKGGEGQTVKEKRKRKYSMCSVQKPYVIYCT